MAEQNQARSPAAGQQPQSGTQDGRQAPKRGKDAVATVPPGESPVGVRVGSEATVSSGTHPVEAPGASAVSEATRVRNQDLAERDKKEWRKRGMREDGSAAVGRPISFSGEGVFVVESGNKDIDDQFVSGGTTVNVPPEGVTIRPLSPKEEAEYFGTPPEVKSQRSNDLVKGGGQGGGGNPMHAGDVLGFSSITAERVGQGGVTSQRGPAPAPRPNNAGPVTPQGGGSTSRSG